MFRRLLIVTFFAGASTAAAQRIEERYEWDTAEGRMMGYYAAALAFTPVAAPRLPRGLEIAFEMAYIPPLDKARRSAGFSKTESTNLLPVLPRPRIAFALPGSVRVEASYVPPVKVMDVKASLLSIALARPVWTSAPWTVTARLSGSSGLTKAPITCFDEMKDEGEGNRLFYVYICHDHESEDRFHTPAVGGELLATRDGGAWTPWAGLGLRHERDRFVPGVKNFDGTPDPNHPILLMTLTRPYGMLGVTWTVARSLALSSELLYAPGSLLTIRAMGTTQLGLPWGGR